MCAAGNPLCPTNPAQPATVVTSGNDLTGETTAWSNQQYQTALNEYGSVVSSVSATSTYNPFTMSMSGEGGDDSSLGAKIAGWFGGGKPIQQKVGDELFVDPVVDTAEACAALAHPDGDYSTNSQNCKTGLALTGLGFSGGGEAVGIGVRTAEGLAAARAEASTADVLLGRAAARSADDILPTPRVSDVKLQNLVDNLYKGTTNPNRVGNGTTMDAIRNESATGLPTGGRMHTTKGEETLRGLNNWLRRNPNADYHDQLVARSLADELSSALQGAR